VNAYRRRFKKNPLLKADICNNDKLVKGSIFYFKLLLCIWKWNLLTKCIKCEHSPELLGVHESYTVEVRNYTQLIIL